MSYLFAVMAVMVTVSVAVAVAVSVTIIAAIAIAVVEAARIYVPCPIGGITSVAVISPVIEQSTGPQVDGERCAPTISAITIARSAIISRAAIVRRCAVISIVYNCTRWIARGVNGLGCISAAIGWLLVNRLLVISALAVAAGCITAMGISMTIPTV